MNYLQILVGIVLCCSAYAQFFPPVNTPNDCNIRCVTTPCPCGTTCPQLSCPQNCQVWQTDRRNCNTCQCASGGRNGRNGRNCPQVRCQPCPRNAYVIDRDGCQTCRCRDQGGRQCPAIRCARPCPNGFERDARGCQTCRCVRNGQLPCPIPGCTNSCPNGYARNARGCQTCRCAGGNQNKPGTCPGNQGGIFGQGNQGGRFDVGNRRGRSGNCISECTNDSNCPGRQKCCGRCARCTNPRPVGRVDKPGVCPRQNLVGPCVVRCFGDASCPGRQKCCGSCPRQCALPIRDSPRLQCPARFSRRQRFPGQQCSIRSISLSNCTRDRDCPGGLCCGQCRRRCVFGRRRLTQVLPVQPRFTPARRF